MLASLWMPSLRGTFSSWNPDELMVHGGVCASETDLTLGVPSEMKSSLNVLENWLPASKVNSWQGWVQPQRSVVY